VDEPTFLLHTGRTYLNGGNPRQALDAFARSAELAPRWVAPKLWQAQSENLLGNFSAAVALTEDLSIVESHLKEAGLSQLLFVRAVALHRSGRTNEAGAYVERFATAHQQETAVISAAAALCANAGLFRAELKWREMLLQREPDRIDWLVKKGQAELRLDNYEAAMQTLTRAVTLAPANGNARLFRAIAALKAGRMEEARSDYRELLKQPDHSQSALFGLGGIAWRTHDTNAMIQYYQAFLSNSAAATPQAVVVTQRLKEWQDE
jgi:tetratricopeptide (TPR) repeat protein